MGPEYRYNEPNYLHEEKYYLLKINVIFGCLLFHLIFIGSKGVSKLKGGSSI
jgi:hypothetical protein